MAAAAAAGGSWGLRRREAGRPSSLRVIPGHVPLPFSPPPDVRAPSPDPNWQDLRLTSFRGAWCRRGPSEWWRLGLAWWGNPRALGSLNGLPISAGWSVFYWNLGSLDF